MSDTKMQLEDWLDDLCVRFIINLPQEDLSSVPRICFQVEEAQWFYEDFIRPLDPTLPSMSLRTFCLRIFQHCPLLTAFPVGVHIQAFEEFLQYKTRIPVRGAILLNEAMDSVLLVRGWKKNANWSFPRGKINKDEDDLDCAVREVYEETGFDIREAGLVPKKDAKYIEVTMRDQQIRLYVFRDVPMDTHFEPRTRKEISKIQWYKLSELPAFRKKGSANNHNNNNPAKNANNANKFYMVAPFLVPLKKWIVQQHKRDAKTRSGAQLVPDAVPEEPATEDDIWKQPEPSQQQAPDLDALENATRELHRLLKMQPPTQGIQEPNQPAAEEDKGGALLALLQSKPSETEQVPHTPLDHTTAEPQQPPTPHHHPAQHPPLAQQNYPPPAFPLAPNAGGAGPWPTNQYPNFAHAPGMPHATAMRAYANNPALVHPQPLPRQVQKTSVLNYTTPPPHVLAQTMRVPQAGFQQPYAQGHPMNQPRQHAGAPLNTHSKALLDSLKGAPSSEQVGAVASNLPPQTNPTYPANQPTASNVAAAAQPYQPGGAAELPADMHHPPNPIPGAGAPRQRGTQTEKQRSTLLGMFKQGGNASPNTSNFQATLAGSASGSKPSSVAGPSPRIPLANLSLQGPSPKPHHPHQGYSNEKMPLPHASAGSSQPLLQLLRRQEEAQVKSQPEPQHAAPITSYSQYYDPTRAVPVGLASPPAPATFPAPLAHRQQDAPPEHKQKLLSLFGGQQQQQQPPPPQRPSGGEVAGEGTVRRDSFQRSVGSGASQRRDSGSRRGSQTPISPANRSFLLSYLQSATNNSQL